VRVAPFEVLRRWCLLHLRQGISKFCTPSTEAIVLLIVENNYNRWVDELENIGIKTKKELAPALYTNAGISQRGGPATSKQGGGWSDEGIQRFNDLVLWVKNDRKNRGSFEFGLMNKMNQENTVKAWGTEKRKAQDGIAGNEVEAFNDFDDVEGEVEDDTENSGSKEEAAV
jgi:hypothetical protein